MATNDNSGNAQIAAATITQMGNIVGGLAANKRQAKYQKEAMALQSQYNKDFWDYQNAYNTPQQQMDRLQAAGLNPRLIYGSGAAGPNTAGPLSPPDVPTRQAFKPEFTNPFPAYLQARQADAQYAATQQSIANMRAQETSTLLKNAHQMMANAREGTRAKYYKYLQDTENKLAAWTEGRAKILMENEGRKGIVLDQLHETRQKAMTSLELDNVFKQNRNELAKYGLYSTDHPAFRMLIQASRRLGVGLDELLKSGVEEYLKF